MRRFLLVAAAAAANFGKLQVPPEVTTKNSWWFANSKPHDREWKRLHLSLANAVVEFVEVGHSQPFASTKADGSGTFVLPEVLPQKTVVRVSHPAFSFHSGYIDARDEGRSEFFILNPHEGLNRLMLPHPEVLLTAYDVSSPFTDPMQLSLWSIAKNPIVFMGVAMLLLSYGLPALVGNMNLKQLRAEAGLDTEEVKFKGTLIDQLHLVNESEEANQKTIGNK